MESLIEQIQDFLSIPIELHLVYSSDPEPDGTDGRGQGHGTADNTGCGYGWAEGSGFGLSGSGSGLDDAGGNGFEDYGGFGFGHALGEGEAYDETADYGDACTSSLGIKRLNEFPVYIIDEIPTIITSIKGNLVQGFVLKEDMTLKRCYIAKQGDVFAHGRTVKQAYALLAEVLHDFKL